MDGGIIPYAVKNGCGPYLQSAVFKAYYEVSLKLQL